MNKRTTIKRLLVVAVILHNLAGLAAGYWLSRMLGYESKVSRTLPPLLEQIRMPKGCGSISTATGRSTRMTWTVPVDRPNARRPVWP